jgi:hypothetical protein
MVDQMINIITAWLVMTNGYNSVNLYCWAAPSVVLIEIVESSRSTLMSTKIRKRHNDNGNCQNDLLLNTFQAILPGDIEPKNVTMVHNCIEQVLDKQKHDNIESTCQRFHC